MAPIVVRRKGGAGVTVTDMAELVALEISQQARDQLAEAADILGISVVAVVDKLARDALGYAKVDQAASEVAAQLEAMERDDPEAWADYVREGEEIERGLSERIVD